jgi:phosphate transport system substrate-binding protein
MARDALVFFTSARTASPACLNANDIYALAGPEAAGLRSWRAAQRVARVLGSRTALPDQPLVVVSPKIGSGTRQLVEDSIIEPAAKRRSTEPSVRSDAVTVPSDQVMLAEVLRVPTALAFGGYATVEPWKDNIRAIAIDGGSGCVVPTEESIRNGSYPLARSLYAYVDVDAARKDPTVGAFAEALVDSAANPGDGAGVISLDPEKAAATADAWGGAVSDGDLTGT